MKTKRAAILSGLISTLRQFAATDCDLSMHTLIDTDEDITVGSAIKFLYDREEENPEQLDPAVLLIISGGGVMLKASLIAAKIAQNKGIGRRQATEQAAVASEVRKSLRRLQQRGLIARNEITKSYRVTLAGSNVAADIRLMLRSQQEKVSNG